MNTTILDLIRATQHNFIDLADLGDVLNMPPAVLLPVIDKMRRAWIITGSCREGRGGITTRQREYTAKDGVGIVSLRV